jgi:sec-independent protein translocase protein TatB
MNIFSNIGITELILILLLALLVVGPERLPELARKLGTTLRDVRKAYDNLTRDLGPELASLQESTRELRESVESVRAIPTDMVQSVVDVSELQETVDDLKGVAGTVESVGDTLNATKKTISDPLGAARAAAKSALSPTKDAEEAEVGTKDEPQEEPAATPSSAASPAQETEVEPTIAPPPESQVVDAQSAEEPDPGLNTTEEAGEIEPEADSDPIVIAEEESIDG